MSKTIELKTFKEYELGRHPDPTTGELVPDIWTLEEVLAAARLAKLHGEAGEDFDWTLEGPWQMVSIEDHKDDGYVTIEAEDIPPTHVSRDIVLGLAVIECGLDFAGADAVSNFPEIAATGRQLYC